MKSKLIHGSQICKIYPSWHIEHTLSHLSFLLSNNRAIYFHHVKHFANSVVDFLDNEGVLQSSPTKKGGLSSFTNSSLVHKCKTLALKDFSTPNVCDKRPTGSGGTECCNSMVAEPRPNSQHISPPPTLYSLNNDDVVMVSTAGKVGGHQHLYVVTDDELAVMSTTDSWSPMASANPDVDEKRHSGNTSLVCWNATEVDTSLHPRH